ncbi:DUF302 domain-containing protein [Loktanella sp. M215]|uniref:DUF302 domain-containing protein n=1 Tax=Loktanella sp. M215 TaxID=2675431 RepID=UPI001F24C9C1|nr:DUF302 domain-containing protein [Loktanella sp. M215]MCF7698924.1 DUF302 domain-containing protein [Loktanella sp. M215]
MRKLALALTLIASPALAQDSTVYDYDGSFDDATFGVESAIVGRGLVVDWVSHVGEMLERTKADVGSDVTIFDNADIYMFCSATLSRKVMEADSKNIAYCPYGVFVTEKDGAVQVGYRHQPDGAMQEVQTLLDDIAREAAGK